MAETNDSVRGEVSEHAAKNYILTVFGDRERRLDIFDIASIFLEEEKWPLIRYLLLGFETCPQTKKDHLQMYIQLKEKKRYVQVHEMLHDNNIWKFHIEKAYRTYLENKKYCTKTGFFEEWGDPTVTGQRNDLKEAVQDILENKFETKEAMVREYGATYARYHGGLDKIWYYGEDQYKSRPFPQIYWWHDNTGMGKSSAMNYFITHVLKVPKREVYKADHADDKFTQWWTGYTGQKVVVFNDFHGNYPLHLLLKVLDTDPMRLRVHFGTAILTSSIFCFTSNGDPLDYYHMEPQQPAWHRRLKEFCIEMPARKWQKGDDEWMDLEEHKKMMQENFNTFVNGPPEDIKVTELGEALPQPPVDVPMVDVDMDGLMCLSRASSFIERPLYDMESEPESEISDYTSFVRYKKSRFIDDEAF